MKILLLSLLLLGSSLGYAKVSKTLDSINPATMQAFKNITQKVCGIDQSCSIEVMISLLEECTYMDCQKKPDEEILSVLEECIYLKCEKESEEKILSLLPECTYLKCQQEHEEEILSYLAKED